MAPAAAADSSAFRLRRWFVGLIALVVALFAAANAWVVSHFLSGHLLQREAAVARDFVQSVLVDTATLAYLKQPQDQQLRDRFAATMAPLARMKDVLRANVYGQQRDLLWSSAPGLAGQQFADNDELDEAMRGELVVHAGRIGADERAKAEHQGLPPEVSYFVETYIPLQTEAGAPVLGVIELYKAPLALTAAIEEGQRQVALAAVTGALLLFASLFWLIRRADRTIHAQQAQLLDAQTLAATGELAAAVAHNIRNPLASIRSSAELALESPEEHGAECARDIVREADRISARIDELLRLSAAPAAERRSVELSALLRECEQDHRETFRRRGQQLHLAPDLPELAGWADAHLLQQVLHSLLANASEAMASGTRCELRLQALSPQWVRIEVADQGPGMAPVQLARVREPFFTTKPQGLGLGLTLAQRTVERWGGRLLLDSRPGLGTTVAIELHRA